MIEVLRGDITSISVDVIVNAANSRLRGGGGVDGAIHRAAGVRLLEHLMSFTGCAPGDAVITPAFDLPARYIVHAVGPIWQGGGHGEADVLSMAYNRAFELALRFDARTIAFPSISTGVYGYPKTDAAKVAVAKMRAYEHLFERIIACVFDPESEAAIRSELAVS